MTDQVDPHERFYPVPENLSRDQLRRMIGRMNFALQHWKNIALDRPSYGNREPDLEIEDDPTPASITYNRPWSNKLTPAEQRHLCGDIVRAVRAGPMRDPTDSGAPAQRGVPVRVPWGSWDVAESGTVGTWRPNPRLSMTAQQQRADNEANGYECPGDNGRAT